MTVKKKRRDPKAHKLVDKSILGFPSGKVAQSIRSVIYRDLSNHDVECITVVLVSHLMIEARINDLIYLWLAKNLPQMSSKNKSGTSVNELARDILNKYIEKLEFSKKVELIKPLGVLLWSDDSKDIFGDIYKINDARISIVHRMDISNIKFGNKSLNTEVGLEHFFDLAQQRLLNISDLIELIGY